MLYISLFIFIFLFFLSSVFGLLNCFNICYWQLCCIYLESCGFYFYQFWCNIKDYPSNKIHVFLFLHNFSSEKGELSSVMFFLFMFRPGWRCCLGERLTCYCAILTPATITRNTCPTPWPLLACFYLSNSNEQRMMKVIISNSFFRISVNVQRMTSIIGTALI